MILYNHKNALKAVGATALPAAQRGIQRADQGGEGTEKLAIKISTVSRITLAVCFCILPSHAKRSTYLFSFFSPVTFAISGELQHSESRSLFFFFFLLAFWGSRSK